MQNFLSSELYQFQLSQIYERACFPISNKMYYQALRRLPIWKVISMYWCVVWIQHLFSTGSLPSFSEVFTSSPLIWNAIFFIYWIAVCIWNYFWTLYNILLVILSNDEPVPHYLCPGFYVLISDSANLPSLLLFPLSFSAYFWLIIFPYKLYDHFALFQKPHCQYFSYWAHVEIIN